MGPGRRSQLPDRKDGRVILHFDYDCFYASVFEVENPALRSLPLAVQQKHIIVTCNYEARRRGLYKLQSIKDAKKICPEVVIVLGEDLTRFRDVSKELYNFLRQFSWNGKVERLGFDEVWLDVTDLIDHNLALLNLNALSESFFQLSRTDPVAGFNFDASQDAGYTYPTTSPNTVTANAGVCEELSLRLRLGSHLAQYLRRQLEEQKLFTATVGVSTSKLLSKLIGNMNKPRGQTTLLPPYSAAEVDESNVISLLDGLEIGKIPGIGFKMAHKIREHVFQRQIEFDYDMALLAMVDKVTVKDVRTYPGMSSHVLDSILGGPGSPRDAGFKVWCLLHGIDDTEVMSAREIPRQISIEDSYGRLDSLEWVAKELKMLSTSLIKRMYADLTETDGEDIPTADEPLHRSTRKWRAHPRTLRLSTCPRPPPNPDGTKNRGSTRVSRSAPIPNYLFTLSDDTEAIAQKLTDEVLVPLFRKLHPECKGWDLTILNVAVTNISETASDSKTAVGRNIGDMFKRQDDVMKQWRVEDRDIPPSSLPLEDSGVDHIFITPSHENDQMKISGSEDQRFSSQTSNSAADDGSWEMEEDVTDDLSLTLCAECGARMPDFAIPAHSRFHILGQ